LTVTALLVLVAGSGMAQDTVLLRYKFNEGAVHTYRVDGHGEGQLIVRDPTGQGGDQATSMVITMQMSYTMSVEAVDEQGNATVEMMMGPIYVSTDTSGQLMQTTIDFATGEMTVNGQPQELPEAMLGLLANGIRMKMSPRGEVVEVEHLQQMTTLLKMSGLSQFDLRDLMKQAGPQLPEDPVEEGDTWTQTVAFKPPGQEADEDETPVMMESTYTMAGFDEYEGRRIAVLNVETDFDLPAQEPTAVDLAGMGGLTITMLRLSQQLQGTMGFDYERGLLVGSTFNTVLNTHTKMEGTNIVDGTEVPFVVDTEMRDFEMTMTLELEE